MATIGTDVSRAARLLSRGELVAIPTETVYGLAGNGLDERAAARIFQVKNRPGFDPLILHGDSLDKLRRLVEEVPARAERLAEAFWPGPLTLLLPRHSLVPDLVTSGLPRVAVRVPDHPLTLELLAALEFPLAAPSANPFGYVSPTTAVHVADQLGDKIPYILDGGPCQVGVESTIVGFEGEETVVYRLGGKRVEDIEALTGPVRLNLNKSSNPAAPGMTLSHYAPSKPVLIGDLDMLLRQYRGRRVGVIAFRRRFPDAGRAVQVTLSPRGSLQEAAAGLFAALRRMDREEVDLILTERFPDNGLGRAINDRLERAAAR